MSLQLLKLATTAVLLVVVGVSAAGGDTAVNQLPKKRRLGPGDAMRAARFDSAATRTVQFEIRRVAPTILVKAGAADDVWSPGHGPGDIALYPRDATDGNMDHMSVVLTARARDQLARVAVLDPETHFMGKMIRVTGRITPMHFTSEAISGIHYELVVDDIGQFELPR